MKAPRFLLSQNLEAKATDQFILHTQKPAILARVVEKQLTTTSMPVNQVRINNYPVYIELIRTFEPTDAHELEQVLNRMANWYLYAVIKKRS
ncbi:hypothetical protein GCM10027275_14300 [Rhabdobacter roseus]